MTAAAGRRRTRLVVLAGPTAVGKGTVAAQVRATHPEVWVSVSATTRPPRPGEQHGVHYWFVTDEQFDPAAELCGRGRQDAQQGGGDERREGSDLRAHGDCKSA